ncbi:ABC transporter ATP-binding protein [Paenibacillus sp.]|jgi:ATP-binding cassette subfamily B protein|uniref:ABC transporter ATP-binding protein n=1 Tax=Paenibacillus sp. TaxID=58172 RepID=UPI00282D935E|nr:ABC transporter ATP-binding protein [Paenibacillus sp.]MDR0270427.1 ABC transporter ATP-binding protein/permease [Paenibacillus sp.]
MNLLYDVTAGQPRRLLRPVLQSLLANICSIGPYGFAAMAVGLIYQSFADPQQAFPVERLWFICGVMGLSMLLLYAGETLAYRSTFRGGYAVSAEGRAGLAEHLRKLPLGTLTRHDSGELGNMIMGNFTQLEHANTHLLPQLVGGALMSVLSFAGFLFVDWRMALAMFAALPVALLVLWAVSGLEQRMGLRHMQARTDASNRLQEYVDGMKLIKAYNLRGANFQRLERSFHRLMKESIRLEGGLGPFFLVAVALVKSGMALMTIVGVYLLLGGELTVSVFAVFLLVGTRIFDPLSVALMNLPEFKYCALAGQGIVSVLKEQVMAGADQPSDAHDVELQQVTFGYGAKNVLDQVSIRMEAGTLTAIVGPSGSGKSTILRLIARFYDPKQGRVLIGGRDASTTDPEALLQRISMVFQDVYLFQDTIGNNIRYGRQGATIQEVEEAARQACCHEFISSLPLGYDTPVGEGGNTLSGGEKQRISIARALLKNAPIVLLDEATASLDPENERDVQLALNRLIEGRTVIMIAHRLKTVVRADQIIVLDQGKVAEHGTHQELLEQGDLYSRLWHIQQSSGGWSL